MNENKEKLLPVITGMFVGVLILSNILACKMLKIGIFVFDGGAFLFPLSYIFGDVLTEVYGYKASRKVIWTGFIMLIVMAINIWVVGFMPSDASWTLQESYNNILMLVPRIILGSIIGYFSGEFTNSFILSKMKLFTKGKHLWMRTIGSTIAGEFVDTVVFTFIAFFGIYEINVLIAMIVSAYFFKVSIEVIFTPLTYVVVNFVKHKENIDVYDYDVKYNPFIIKD